jgi:hypothetical protein
MKSLLLLSLILSAILSGCATQQLQINSDAEFIVMVKYQHLPLKSAQIITFEDDASKVRLLERLRLINPDFQENMLTLHYYKTSQKVYIVF